MHDGARLVLYPISLQVFEVLFVCAEGAKSTYAHFQHFVQLCRWLLLAVGHDIDFGGPDGLKYSSPQITASAIGMNDVLILGTAETTCVRQL